MKLRVTVERYFQRLKSVLVFVLLFHSVTLKSNAQIFQLFTDIDQFEIVAGPNLYYLNYDETETDQVYEKIGFSCAINLHHDYKPRIGIATKLFYDHFGFISKFATNYFDNLTGTIKTGEIRAETFSNLLGLAMLAQIDLTKNSNVYFEVGPYVNYFLSGRSVRTFLWNGNTSTSYFHGDDRFSGGINFSIGYYFPTKKSFSPSVRLSDNVNLINYNAHTFSLLVGFKLK